MQNREYIALLRGVNVGGRTVKMDRLRLLFEGMGFGAVRTYIQSGNVLFAAPVGDAVEEINTRIEEGLAAALGFQVSVVLLTAEDLGSILSANPFAGHELSEGSRVYITVFRGALDAAAAQKLQPDPRSADEYVVSARAAYILCHGGYHETVYSNNYFEKKLKVATTTRNLEVLSKLLEMIAPT